MQRFNTLPLFWQVYVFIVAVLVVVVGLTEFFLEPWVEILVLGKVDPGIDWYEAPVWTFSILALSIACGFIISRKLTRRLSTMALAARSIARGNLSVRLPEGEDEKNPFNDLAQSFNLMADAVTRQLLGKQRLLADISHELRSPLARMAVAVELLEKTHDPEKKAATLQRMEKEIRHMGDLVAQLLSQARERGLETGVSEKTDFALALSDIADNYRFQAEARGIAIRTEFIKNIWIQARPSQLRTIFGNILDNALFYAPHGGAVMMAMTVQEKTVRVAVRDQGPGVPDEKLTEIFRAFYRVDESRSRASGGAGLGLAIAKAEAGRLGGDIAAENARPGLCITVTLPLPEKNPDA